MEGRQDRIVGEESLSEVLGRGLRGKEPHIETEVDKVKKALLTQSRLP